MEEPVLVALTLWQPDLLSVFSDEQMKPSLFRIENLRFSLAFALQLGF